MFIFTYDFEDGSYPLKLRENQSSVAFTTGAATQMDAIMESAISATGVVGKNNFTKRQAKKRPTPPETLHNLTGFGGGERYRRREIFAWLLGFVRFQIMWPTFKYLTQGCASLCQPSRVRACDLARQGRLTVGFSDHESPKLKSIGSAVPFGKPGLDGFGASHSHGDLKVSRCFLVNLMVFLDFARKIDRFPLSKTYGGTPPRRLVSTNSRNLEQHFSEKMAECYSLTSAALGTSGEERQRLHGVPLPKSSLIVTPPLGVLCPVKVHNLSPEHGACTCSMFFLPQGFD